MKSNITILLFAIVFSASAQTPTFNKFFGTAQDSILVSNFSCLEMILNQNACAAIVGYTTDGLSGNVGILRIDEFGNFTDFQRIYSDYSFWIGHGASALVNTQDTGLVLATNLDGQKVFKCDNNFNLQWQIDLAQGTSNYFEGVMALPNGELLILSKIEEIPFSSRILQRIDSNGELLNDSFEILFQGTIDVVSSFLIDGSNLILAARDDIGFFQDRKNELISLNWETGEVNWHHVHEFNGGFGNTGIVGGKIVKKADGELGYVFGQADSVPLGTNLNDGYYGRLYASDLNSESGEFSDVQAFTTLGLRPAFIDALPTPDNGYVILTRSFNEDSLYYGPNLIKLDENKEVEWNHHYFPPMYESLNDVNVFYKFGAKLTLDDGIVVVGSFKDTSGEILDGRTTLWTFKTDACGELISNNCTLSGLGELSQQQAITIYPNPARDRIFLKGKNSIQQAMIYDLQGKLMHDERFSGASEQTLFIDHLPAGLYVVKAMNNEGEWSSERIMVSGEDAR